MVNKLYNFAMRETFLNFQQRQETFLLSKAFEFPLRFNHVFTERVMFLFWGQRFQNFNFLEP